MRRLIRSQALFPVLFALALWGAMPAGAAPQAPVLTEEIAIPIAEAPGFRKEGEGFVPLRRCVDLSGPAAWEAENADEAVWAKGGEARREGAAGPTFVAGFQALRTYYRAEKPAEGVLWARLRQGEGEQTLYLDEKGAWSSRAEFAAAGKDPAAEHRAQAGKWRWARLGRLAVTPGVHVVQVIAQWPGYNHPPLDPWPQELQIDSFAVTFGDARPDDAPRRETAPPPAECRLESGEIRLPAAQALLSARVEGAAPGGVLEASVDGGATWRPAERMPLAGTLRLRVRFPAGLPAQAAVGGAPAGEVLRAGGASLAPAGPITGFRARLALDGRRALAVGNGKARLLLDLDAGGVFRLESPALGRTFALPDAAVPLFALELKQRGKPWPDPRHWLRPADGKLVSARAQGGTATLEYAFLEGKLVARAAISLAEGLESTWALSLDNRSEWDVLTYTFPRLAGLRVGGSGYDDRWLNTNVYGPWLPGTNCHGAFRPEDRPYPGWGALGFVDLFDGRAGLSLATREPEVGSTNFILRPTTARAGETVSLEAVKEHSVPAGTRRTWSYALLLHPGDWHAAADAYGGWFRARFGTADHWPQWAREENGWIQTNPSLADARFRWPMLLDTFEEGRRIGIRHLQVWGQFGSSSCGSFWWPSPKYGPIEEFAQVNRTIRERDGHVGYYLMYDRENRYNLIDRETYEGYLPQSAYPPGVPILGQEAFIRSAMVTDPEGRVTAWPGNEREMSEFRANLARLHAEKKPTTWADSATWPAHSMAKMNPRAPQWQEWLVRWTAGLYAGAWHCDTAYQDVLGCANMGRSFDLRGGDHGEVYSGEMDVARRLVEEGRKVEPTFALSAEGKSELVTRWAMGMTSNKHYGWSDLAAVRYTHPDHILFYGGCNGGYQRMAANCDIAFLYGARFDLILTGDRARVRRAVAFRETFRRSALRAAYRDTVGLSVAGRGIEATRHDRVEPGTRALLVTALNRDGVGDGMLTLDTAVLPPAPRGAFWLADDWSASAATLAPAGDGKVATPIPAAHLSALLVVSQARPEEALLGGVEPERTPGGCRAKVWLANLGPRPRQVAVRLAGPGLDSRTLSADLPAYGVFTRTVEGAFAGGGPTFGDVTLSAEGKELAMGFLYPLVEDGSFEKDGIQAADAADGERVARVGPGKGWQGCHRVLALAPGHRYRLSVQTRRMKAQGNPFALVRLRDGEGKWHHHGLQVPKERLGAWAPLTVEFDTPATLQESDIYFYNSDSEAAVDYDNVRAEMVG